METLSQPPIEEIEKPKPIRERLEDANRRLDEINERCYELNKICQDRARQSLQDPSYDRSLIEQADKEYQAASQKKLMVQEELAELEREKEESSQRYRHAKLAKKANLDSNKPELIQ